MSNKVHNKYDCRQSEESRFPSRRFAPQDDAGRLEDRQAYNLIKTKRYTDEIKKIYISQ